MRKIPTVGKANIQVFNHEQNVLFSSMFSKMFFLPHNLYSDSHKPQHSLLQRVAGILDGVVYRTAKQVVICVTSGILYPTRRLHDIRKKIRWYSRRSCDIKSYYTASCSDQPWGGAKVYSTWYTCSICVKKWCYLSQR